MTQVSLAITGAARLNDLLLLWQPVVLAVLLVAVLVLAAIIIITRVTSAPRAPHISDVALQQLVERRECGEISEQQFELARAMLLAAAAAAHASAATSSQTYRTHTPRTLLKSSSKRRRALRPS